MATNVLQDIDMSPDENSLLNSPKSAQHLKDSRLSKDETNDTRKDRTHFQSLYSLIYCICACNICLQLSAFVSDPSNISGVFFNAIGCILYIFDVVTDTLTGLFYISGKNMDSYMFGNRNITNYTNPVCEEFDDYSHPVWGSLVLGLIWAPALSSLPSLLVMFARAKEQKSRVEEQGKVGNMREFPDRKTLLLVLIMILFWPVSGLIMILRQFATINNFLEYILPDGFLVQTYRFLRPSKIKLLEACLEAPFQLILQMYVVVAGKTPSALIILSMMASMMSIASNLMIGNGFGNELNTYKMIVLRIKIAPMILATILFRCLSVVIFTTYLRLYSIIPILLMFSVQHFIFNYHIIHHSENISAVKRLVQKEHFLRDVFMEIEYKILALTSGQIIYPKSTVIEVVNVARRRRIKLLWVDSLCTLAVYGIFLMAIIFLWNATSLLKENPNECTSLILKENTEIICGSIIGLGVLSFGLSFIYRYID